MKHVWSIYVSVFMGCLLHLVQAQNTTTFVNPIFKNQDNNNEIKFLQGNWYNASHQLEWVFGVHDSAFIYKNQIWQYEKTTTVNSTVNSISLVNGKQKTVVFVQYINEEECKIGSSTTNMVTCTKYQPNDVLKTQMGIPSFTYTGSFSNTHVAAIAVVIPITDKQATCKISSAFGEFTPQDYRNNCYYFTIPVYFAQYINVAICITVGDRRTYSYQTMFVTPGANNILFINKDIQNYYSAKYRFSNKLYSHSVCMGSNANANNLLFFLEQSSNYRSYMFSSLQKGDSINSNTPAKYRNAATANFNINNQIIQKLYDSKITDFQEYTILKKHLNAEFAKTLLLFQSSIQNYKMRYQTNPETVSQPSNIPVDSDTGYRQALILALADSAILYANDSRSLLSMLLSKENAKKNTPSIVKLIEHLQEKGTLLTNADIALYAQLKKAQMGIEDSSLNLDALEVATKEFKKRYRKQIERYNNALNAKTDLEYLQDYYQFPDWTHDLLLFYPILGQINNYSTENEELVNKYRELAKSKTITGIIDNEIRRIQKLPAMEGSVVMKTPRSNDYELLQAIAKQHEGKMILVDFWATWCAPCRAGMQILAPLKEALKYDSVAFVNIASDNSPEDVWKTMIKQIKGYHYYLTADDWRMLTTQYYIKGIPRYMVINKKGNILVADYNIYDNPEKLKRILLDKP